MNKRLITITGMISLAVILAACGGVAQGDTSASDSVNEAQPAQLADAESSSDSAAGAASEEETTSAAAVEQDSQESAITSRQPTFGLERLQPENELGEGNYAWNQLLPRDGIAPIYEPEFVPANEAPYDDNELVIGVEINGKAKAYAIGPLNGREMVNDTLGGTPILVTW